MFAGNAACPCGLRVLNHGTDFITRPARLTNCQDVRPAATRTAHVPSAVPKRGKDDPAHVGLLSRWRLTPVFRTRTGSRASPQTARRPPALKLRPRICRLSGSRSRRPDSPRQEGETGERPRLLPGTGAFPLPFRHTPATAREGEKPFFLRLKSHPLGIGLHIRGEIPHICRIRLIFVQKPHLPGFPCPAFISREGGERHRPATRPGTNAAICQSSPSPGTNRPPRRRKGLCGKARASLPAQSFPASPVRNRSPVPTSSRPCSRPRSRSGLCGNTPPALS